MTETGLRLPHKEPPPATRQGIQPEVIPVIRRSGEPARSHWIARTVLAAVLLGLALWTLQSFLPALVWAAIFAIATWPLYQRILKRWPPRRRSILLPACFTLAIGLIFVGPLGFLAVQFAHEAKGLFAWVDSIQKTGLPMPDWVSHLPFGGQISSWWNDNLNDPDDVHDLLSHMNKEAVFSFSRHLGSQLVHRVLLFLFTLLTLFFLFRDGERLTDQLLKASHRAFGPRGERVGRQIINSVHGTVDGLVLVGLGVGVLLGIAYAIAGVPHPTMFGALTAVGAMIPFAAPVAFGAASLLLFAQGSTIAAAVLFLFGSAVVFIADHFVRPFLIGGATRIPFILVLLGILGGIETWGFLGLFLGPAIMAALTLLWREWTEGPADS